MIVHTGVWIILCQTWKKQQNFKAINSQTSRNQCIRHVHCKVSSVDGTTESVVTFLFWSSKSNLFIFNLLYPSYRFTPASFVLTVFIQLFYHCACKQSWVKSSSIFDIPHLHSLTHSNHANKKCVSPYFCLISSCLSCISVLLFGKETKTNC